MRALLIGFTSALMVLASPDSSQAMGPRFGQGDGWMNQNRTCQFQQRPGQRGQNFAQGAGGQQLRKRDGSCGQQQCLQGNNNQGLGQGQGRGMGLGQGRGQRLGRGQGFGQGQGSGQGQGRGWRWHNGT